MGDPTLTRLHPASQNSSPPLPPNTSDPTHTIMADQAEVDYSLSNPDTLTKYKTAAQISNKVLEAVTGMPR